jgi:hypothetical protein
MSKEQPAAASSELGVLIGAVQAEYETEIGSIVIDPREVPLAMMRRVAKLPFPTLAREREAAGFARSNIPIFARLIRERQYETLNRTVAEVEAKINLLARPERRVSVQAQANNARATFRAMSWMDQEVEALRFFDRGGAHAQISEIGISSVKIGGDLVTRADIRKKLKACGACSFARLTEMERQEKEAIDLEAANRVRRDRGEGLYHRNW